MNEFQEHIGVGRPSLALGRLHGTTRQRDEVRQDNGKPAGFHTDHWDGRVDATIFPPTITKNIMTGEVTHE